MNNFDKSSSVDLELSVVLDYDLAQIYAEDNFYKINYFDGDSLLNDRYFNVDIYNFTGGYIVDDLDFSDLELYDIDKTNKNIIIEYIKNNCDYSQNSELYYILLAEINFSDINVFTHKVCDYILDNNDINLNDYFHNINNTKELSLYEKIEVIETFIKENDFDLIMFNENKTFFDFCINKQTKQDLLYFLENETETYDFTAFLIKNCNPKFNVFSVRGYSQGDYAEIIILDSLLKEYECKTFDEFYNLMSDYIHNILYDVPFSARLSIDEDEFCFNEYIEDSYNYNKEELLQIAKDHIKHNKKEYIINWLNENLTNHLGY